MTTDNRQDVQKVLMTNDLKLTAARMVELYDLRWQIELFFKELNISEKQRRWWQTQRTHGLCVLIRQATEKRELERLAEYAKIPPIYGQFHD